MPIFNHQCDSCGREEQVMTRSVAESPVWPQCCGEGMPRVHRSNRRHTGVFEKPIEMYSVALADETDIAVFRGRNPGVDVSTDRRSPLFGVPIARTRQQKLAVLRAEGFEELN